MRITPLMKQNLPLVNRYWNLSFSLFGEDRVIYKLLIGKISRQTPGLYVDIGCAGPYQNSNTILLYLMGWSGIAVDPNPVFTESFRKYRPQDRAIHAAVGPTSKDVFFAAHQRFEERGRVVDSMDALSNDPDYREPVAIPCHTLAEIFEKNLPVPDAEIDFLDVDVEGMDLEILKSNDWSRFQPRLICVEDFETNLVAYIETPVHRYLASVGYTLHSSTFISKIYTHESFLR
jgi:FkbM family methyltransferase